MCVLHLRCRRKDLNIPTSRSSTKTDGDSTNFSSFLLAHRQSSSRIDGLDISILEGFTVHGHYHRGYNRTIEHKTHVHTHTHTHTQIYIKKEETMDELTRAVTVKRTAKKKSGYTVSEQNGVYYVSEAPAKARVKPGDKIVGINGIRSDDFLDEDDANDLIESIRIVVVPEDKLEEYDDAAAAAAAAADAENGGDDDDDDDDEEQYEEYDRRNKSGGSGRSNKGEEEDRENVNRNNAPHGSRGLSNGVPNPAGAPGSGVGKNGTIQCNHCGHDNDDLSVDEDGDYVCEGTMICGVVCSLVNLLLDKKIEKFAMTLG